MNIELRHIRYFAAVAEDLHFRRAAERLGIAQPALSRTISHLERELGVTLFHRNNRSVQITDAGKRFLEGGIGLMNALAHVVEETKSVHEGRIGSVRIGYTDNAIAGVLPSLVKRFQEEQPGIVLKPFHYASIAQLEKLERGELDFGFITGPIQQSGYEQCPVQSEAFVCVTPDTHPLARRQSIALAELKSEDFVHGSSAQWEHFYSYLLPLCRRSGFVPNIVQEAFNTAGILGLVACGMGVTVLAECVRSSVGPGLAVIPIEDVSERLQTVAIWKSGARGSSTDHFAEFLRRTSDPQATTTLPGL